MTPLPCRLPPSLVECSLRLDRDFNIGALTRLTKLKVHVARDISVTFPTQLKELRVEGNGVLVDSNIAQVGLESIEYFPSVHRLMLHMLEDFPTTLRKVDGKFDPDSLRNTLPELFPLLAPNV